MSLPASDMGMRENRTGHSQSDGSGLVVLKSSRDGRSAWLFSTKELPYEIRPSPGAGLGVFATRRILAGECVLSEAPLVTHEKVHAHGVVTWPIESLDDKVRRLRPAKRAEFHALSQNEKYGVEKTLTGIWMTNAFTVEHALDGTPQRAAVFSVVCRFNHSCRPNLHNEWREEKGSKVVFAAEDIEEGAELTVTYLPKKGLLRTERQAGLFDKFCFYCHCSLCAQVGSALKRSERRQERLIKLDRLIEAVEPRLRENGRTSQSLDTLTALVEEKISLLAMEGLPMTWGLRDLYLCAVESKRSGADNKARAYAARAAECALRGGGDECNSYVALKAFLAA